VPRLSDTPGVWRRPAPEIGEHTDELLEELGDRQVVVCALSRQLVELASARLEVRRVPHGLLTGRVREDDRRRNLTDFRAGKTRVLLMTIQAGGTGVDGLQVADTMVFLQRSWSIVDNKQAEDRVHRIGSEVHSSVNIVDVIAADTVELKQVAKLHHKLALLQEVNRDTMDEVLTTDDDLRGVL